MNTRTSTLAVALASASISALTSTSVFAWEGPKVEVPKAIQAVDV